MNEQEDPTDVAMNINDREGIGASKLRPIWDRTPIRDDEPITEITRRIPLAYKSERAYLVIKAFKELLRRVADAVNPETDRIALKVTLDSELVRVMYAIRPALQ